MTELAAKTCIPCSGGVPPLPLEKRIELLSMLNKRWNLTCDSTRISATLDFDDFKKPLDLLVQIGEIAERQWHHPELKLGWGHLDIEIWTHKIGSLVESDFILAAKIDQLLEK